MDVDCIERGMESPDGTFGRKEIDLDAPYNVLGHPETDLETLCQVGGTDNELLRIYEWVF
jgi:hypothetical protein